MFAAVQGKTFDTIIFNIPLLDKPIEDPLEIIACDEGGALVMRFMNEAKHHLSPRGHVCMSLSNIGNRTAILKALTGYQESIVHAEYYESSGEWRWLLAAQPE